MRRIITFLALFFAIQVISAQIVINELDADSDGVDNKEFVELKTATPFSALDGYVLVFFNGSNAGGNKSYYTIDLDGYTSDVNGIFLIGSADVSPIPQLLIYPNTIQNGTDAVAIYHADATDFPDWTLPTTNNLIDALVYETGDALNLDLIQLLGQTGQIDEDENNNKDFESIQRKADGTYKVATPTPRQNNDGSGILLNGIDVHFSKTSYNEGETVTIDFSLAEPVNSALIIDFSLANEAYNFDHNDFSGPTTLTIPSGESTGTTSVQLLDDGQEEGDEVLLFQFVNLPSHYVPIKNYVETRVVDVNFEVAGYGTPLNPTYEVVESTQPDGYYASLEGLAGEELKQAIQAIIANPDVVRVQTYTDVIDILMEADQNPANSNQVWLIYTEQGRSKLDFQTTSDNTGKWNREHIFPQSRGEFEERSGDDYANGKNVYWKTSADSTRQGYSDAHHLRAVDGPENSSRGNQNYGPQAYHGPTGTAGSFKGDVARSLFYMAIRFKDLSVVNGYPSSTNSGKIGDLQTLLMWHQADPPDDYEMHRNNVIYTWQHNRNPFIDYPDLASYIWGDHMGEVWHQPDFSVNNPLDKALKIYPNPVDNTLNIAGVTGNALVEIFALDGRVLKTKSIKGEETNMDVSDLQSGVYFLRLETTQNHITKKIIVK